jgi:phosphoribosylformylglycinamidine synthase
MWLVKINIRLKKGVLDAQGKTTQQALLALGFHEVKEVRIGKLIELEMDGSSPEEVEKEVKEMAQKLLTNPVIEDFDYEIKAGEE